MERTLHRQLKHLYAQDDQVEVVVDGFRIDAIRDGELIEVQCSTLSSIRGKLAKLCKRHAVRLIKPMVHRTKIAKKVRANARKSSLRWSPKRGDRHEVFGELVSVAKLIGNPNFCVEIPRVDVLETRVPDASRRRRRKPHRVLDVSLIEIHEALEVRSADDVWQLIGVQPLCNAFNSQALADAAGCCRWRAQQMAYVLRHSGAVQTIGRTRAGHQYRAVA